MQSRFFSHPGRSEDCEALPVTMFQVMQDFPPPVPEAGVADDLAPPPLPPSMDPRPKGRGREPAVDAERATYDVVIVHSLDDPTVQLGSIRLNEGAASLDVHCKACKGRRSRTWLRVNAKTERGRPMGAHLAWLQLCPGTDAAARESRYTATDLPLEFRAECRSAYCHQAGLRRAFELEFEPADFGRECSRFY